jgi:hypothetical protein
VVLPALGLSAVLVLLARPLVAALSARGSALDRGERGLLAWMAPRGIVAASTAAAFSSELEAKGLGGASRILPATFVVIVATVTLYGLTALPVARRLGVVRPARSRPLLVGGTPWVIDLAVALREAGVPVLMWAGDAQTRERATAAGLELAGGELLSVVSATGVEELGLTSVFLLEDDDRFNALAAAVIRAEDGFEVYRLGGPEDAAPVAASAGQVLFGGALTGAAASRRHHEGARIATLAADLPIPAGCELLFTVDAHGLVKPVTAAPPPLPPPGARLAVLLG